MAKRLSAAIEAEFPDDPTDKPERAIEVVVAALAKESTLRPLDRDAVMKVVTDYIGDLSGSDSIIDSADIVDLICRRFGTAEPTLRELPLRMPEEFIRARERHSAGGLWIWLRQHFGTATEAPKPSKPPADVVAACAEKAEWRL